MAGLFDSNKPIALPTPGTSAYEQAVNQDNGVYDSTFKNDALSLRNIALGVTGTAGDARAASTDAISDAGSRFDVGASGLSRAQRALGQTPDASTAKSQSRRLGLARIISQVDAGNKASRNANSIRESAQEFGTQFWSDTSTGANSILAGIARSESDRNAQYASAQQSARASQVGLAGSLLSMI